MRVVFALLIVVVGGVALADDEPVPVFVSAKTHAEYLRLLPAGVLSEAEKGRVIFYDRATVPQAYPFQSSWHAISYNISAVRSEPFGNPNREFPWLTGGMDNVKDGSDFKFLVLPAGQKIRGEWQALPGGFVNEPAATMVGIYPAGTKVGEVLLMGADNDRLTFEARVLEKKKSGDIFDFEGNWTAKVWRPIVDRDHLMSLAKLMDEDYHTVLEKHYAKGQMDRDVLQNHHPKLVFREAALLDELPDPPRPLLRRLLHRRFQDVTDRAWVEGNAGTKAYAPASGIVPRGYQGAFFNGKSCAKCHATVLKAAIEFESRDWYGRARGGDGIFSLPICDEDCVSPNGINRPAQWSRKMIRAGILEVRGDR